MTYPSSLAKPSIPIKTFNSYRLDLTPKEDKDKGKGKEIAKEAPKNQKKCFECRGYSYF